MMTHGARRVGPDSSKVTTSTERRLRLSEAVLLLKRVPLNRAGLTASLENPPEGRTALARFCDPANDLLGPADRFSVYAASDLLLAKTPSRFFCRV
jgi:hypothetical protein